MAVYTTYTAKAQYYSGDMGGCVGGGADYRTVEANQIINNVWLAIDPQFSKFSNACEITHVKMTCQYRLTNTSNNSGSTLKGKLTWTPFTFCDPAINGTQIILTTDNLPDAHDIMYYDYSESYNLVIGDSIKGNTSYKTYIYDKEATAAYNSGNYRQMVGGRFTFTSQNSILSCRMWLYDVTFEVTRTRACRIRFEVDGEEKSVKIYDYGTIPIYEPKYGNNTPIKSGYKFYGWKSSADGKIYTGTLPTAYETDVTYSAVFMPVYITYDSIFNFLKWKEKGITSGRGTISNITETGFSFTASVDDGYTGYSHMFTVEPGKTYTLEYDCSGGSSYQSFVFFHATNGDYSWTKLFDSAKTKWNFTVPDGFYLASIRVDVNTKGETINFSNFRIYPADCDFMSSTVASSERCDSIEWSISTPTRNYHTFLGWNTKADGSGRYYTASSTYPSDDLVLYSVWKAAKIFIGTAQPSKIYVGTQEVKEVYIGTTKVYG